MKGTTIILIIIVGFIVLNAVFLGTQRLPFSATGIGIMIAAGLTLAMYSFLYKDNPLFKFSEHLYVGIGMGYVLCYYYFHTIEPNLIMPLFMPKAGVAPDYWLIVPGFFGILMFSRFHLKYAWLSRWSFAFMVGYGAGMVIPRMIKSNILMQAKASVEPLVVGGATFDFVNLLWSLIVLIGVLTVLIYFFFSLEHKGPVGKVSRIGVWFLMIGFGAAFGYTVMGRVSLLIGRVLFLLGDWLRVL